MYMILYGNFPKLSMHKFYWRDAHFKVFFMVGCIFAGIQWSKIKNQWKKTEINITEI